jgi:hypothetical protein
VRAPWQPPRIAKKGRILEGRIKDASTVSAYSLLRMKKRLP